MSYRENRKFKLTFIAFLLITAGWLTTSINPVLASSYSELVTGVMGVFMLYLGGNVGSQFVFNKFNQKPIVGGKDDAY